jgi:DNA-binding transcriptional regulator YhcF (GntR family)
MAHSALDLALERDIDVPLGTQLAWKLRAAIAGGALKPGDRMPAVRELAAHAGVNVNTVRAVYSRLAKQGVVVSEQGRGTFVGSSPGGTGLSELVERAAEEARRQAVDPRDLAAMLYARFDHPEAGPVAHAALDAAPEAEARHALRREIEALEHELARLEPQFAERRAAERAGAGGARLVSASELEATRDELSARVADRHRELRVARRKARAEAPQPSPQRARRASPWPELLAARPAATAPRG